MRYYPFRLSAPANLPGDTLQFLIAGNFIRYDFESTLAAQNKIHFRTDTGDFITLKPGQSVRLARSFNRVDLSNAANVATLEGFLAIAGPGETVEDSNIQGSVNILGAVTLPATAAGAPGGGGLE